MTVEEPSTDTGEYRPDRYEQIVETIPDGVFVLNSAGTLVFVNDAVETFIGLDRDELVGETFEKLVEQGLFDASTYDRFREAFTSICAGESDEKRVTIETAHSLVLEIRLCGRGRNETVEEVVGTVRDVTQRERALETVERQQRAIYRLYEADIDSELTAGEKIERALDIGCEFLSLPIGFLTSIDGDTQRYDHVVGYDDLEGTSGSLQSSYCRFTVESDDPVAIQDAETELGSDDPTYAQTGVSCYIGTKIPVNGELYGTFCFAAADARDRAFSESEREFVRLLGLWAGHALERQRFESTLRGLHDVGKALLSAETNADVAQLGVDAAAELFDLPITACWHYDETTDSLRPLAETAMARDLVGETPTFERGSALAWESFDAGEFRTYENLVEETNIHNPDTSVESEIHVPLGRQGILVTGSTEPRAFENVDIESLRLLGDLLRDGLIDVEQKRALEERGEALQRQNEQLEEFAHVVAHDLRNPLAGAIGFLEIARETHDDQHFDRVETSHDRMKDLIEELLDIARETRRAADRRELPLSGIIEEAWSYVDAPAATLSVAGNLGVIHADETRLLQLFGNLFRNSVEHAGDDVTVEVGRLESGTGFYVEDNGPGLPEGAREDVLTLGRTTSETGTGIGLDSVTDIIGAHGWELRIPKTEGGARFEMYTSEAQR